MSKRQLVSTTVVVKELANRLDKVSAKNQHIVYEGMSTGSAPFEKSGLESALSKTRFGNYGTGMTTVGKGRGVQVFHNLREK